MLDEFAQLFQKMNAARADNSHARATDDEVDAWNEFGSKLRSMYSPRGALYQLPEDLSARDELETALIEGSKRRLEIITELRKSGDLELADAAAQDGFEAIIEELGADHPLALPFLNARCAVLAELGQPAAAEAYARQGLAEMTNPTGREAAELYMLRAGVLHQNRSFDAAVECYSDTIRIAAEIEDATTVYWGKWGEVLCLRELGRYSEAENALTELRSQVDEKPESFPVDRLQFIHQLAVLMANQGKLREASSEYARAILNCREQLPQKNEMFVTLLRGAITVEQVLGNLSLVESLQTEMLSHLQPDHPAFVQISSEVVERRAKQGVALKECLQSIGDLQTHISSAPTNTAAEYAAVLEAWAAVAGACERPRAKRWALQRLVEVQTELVGSESPEVAAVYLEAADLHISEGRLREALELSAGTMQVLEKMLGDQHPLFARSVSTFGRACLEVGALDDAEEALTRSVKAYTNAIGADATNTVLAQSCLGAVQFHRGDFTGAESIFRTTTKKLEGAVPLDRQRLGITVNLVGALTRLERYGEAQEYLDSVVEESDNLALPRTQLAQIQNQQICLHASQKEFQAGIMASRRAESLINRAHPVQAVIFYNRGACHAALGQLNEANAAFQRALEVSTDTLGKDHYRTVMIEQTLTQAVRNEDRTEKLNIRPMTLLFAA